MVEASRAPESVDDVESLLERGDYVAARPLATALYLALTMRRPLLLEGEAGVGKTEIARVLATMLGRRLIRLQCYEGLDLASAAWEWNYPRQMVAIRLAEARGEAADLGSSLWSEAFLIERPLLAALRTPGAPVLLIDELDRADEPFEAFLLELLSDYQMSIPELGTIRAVEPPVVIITSNRTRDVHDALRRRCLYHWVDYPSAAAETRILERRAPGVAQALRQQVVAFVARVREEELYKRPGVAETIDWAHALAALDATELSAELVEATLGSLLKYQDDIAAVAGERAARLLEDIRSAA